MVCGVGVWCLTRPGPCEDRVAHRDVGNVRLCITAHPLNNPSVAVDSISVACLHERPMRSLGTCRRANEIKEASITHTVPAFDSTSRPRLAFSSSSSLALPHKLTYAGKAGVAAWCDRGPAPAPEPHPLTTQHTRPIMNEPRR